MRTILNYKDYEALPAGGRRYELHEGELSVTLSPSPKHQEVSLNLAVLLHHHVKTRGKVFEAPIDCILSDVTIVQPDIVYLETGRLPTITSRGIEGAPTLAVEILSPSTSQIDRGVKFQLYARHWIPHYWIVDPDSRSIEAYHLTEGTYQLTGRLEGPESASFPPFSDVGLNPATIWP